MALLARRRYPEFFNSWMFVDFSSSVRRAAAVKAPDGP
jgi:hypothetical protein